MIMGSFKIFSKVPQLARQALLLVL